MTDFNVAVAIDADDDWADADATLETTYAFIQVGNSSGTKSTGILRFDNITVPKGATISDAHITFTHYGDYGSTVLSNIYVLAEDDYAAPTSSAEFVTDKGFRAGTPTTWDFAVGAGSVTTPNFSGQFQALVDRAGWASGQACGIHIVDDGSSSDNFQRFDDKQAGTAAVLYVVYTSGPAAPTISVSQVGADILVEWS